LENTENADNLKNQIKKVESIGTVRDGRIVGEFDFYHYLAAFEGQDVKWTLEPARNNKL
jgi:hypothetical protein